MHLNSIRQESHTTDSSQRNVISGQEDTVDYIKANEETIVKIARERLKHQSFPEIFMIQALSECRFRLMKGLNFRKRKNEEACQAYSEMEIRDFEGINARQQWSNWRTIPKNLNGRIPNRPIQALDLCCGTGHSTEVLACYLPYGSNILGIDFNPSFIKKARTKKYPHQSRKKGHVTFRAQSVLEPFHDAENQRIPDQSIDLVNSCGAVGFHFDASSIEVLAREIARVIKPGGLATIDVGLPGDNRKQVARIFKESGFKIVHAARSCLLDPREQICFQKI